MTKIKSKLSSFRPIIAVQGVRNDFLVEVSYYVTQRILRIAKSFRKLVFAITCLK